MSLIELFLIAVGLSMDAFAVSICKGLSMQKMNGKNAFIIGLYFGGFQALMPLLGYLLGSRFQNTITAYDHWIAFQHDKRVFRKRGGMPGSFRGLFRYGHSGCCHQHRCAGCRRYLCISESTNRLRCFLYWYHHICPIHCRCEGRNHIRNEI